MRAYGRLLASAAKSPQAHSLRPPPVALLPPIPLYRRILRTHRKKLPGDMRLLGDKYVKDEFKRHQQIDNPIHIVGFLTQWQDYAQQLEGDSWREEKLDKEVVDKMSDQQIGQLYELMQAIRQEELGIEKATDSEDVIEVDKKS